MRHLPEDKQRELKQIVSCLLSHESPKIEMIVLFGSYARGDWVIDQYLEDGITYTYVSDFDLLVILENCNPREQLNTESVLTTTIENNPNILTPVSIIAHDIHTINAHLEKKQYFFSDIKRQGIKLYDSGRHKLARLKRLRPKDRYVCAVEDFKYWFESANEFYNGFSFYLSRNTLNKAAFMLHQTTEHLYHALLLVFTHYKPKLHDLRALRKRTNSLDSQLIKTFPIATPEDKRLFELLRRAYVDSRYRKGYVITQSELETLKQNVKALKRLTQTLCQTKIAELKEQIPKKRRNVSTT